MADMTPLIVALQGITFSQSEVAKIYRCRKEKAAKMFGTELRVTQAKAGGRMAVNAWDVLKPLVEQCLRAQPSTAASG